MIRRNAMLGMLTVSAIGVCAFAAALAVSTPAGAYAETVKAACASDYSSLCARYKPGSTMLRRCFESNRKVLSNACIQALVNAGEVPAKYLRK